MDNPLRKFQIWIIDNIGQLKLADMVDDLCIASVSRKLLTINCSTRPDATMQFLIPDAEGSIKQEKNGSEFVVGFDAFSRVRLFEESSTDLISQLWEIHDI